MSRRPTHRGTPRRVEFHKALWTPSRRTPTHRKEEAQR